MPIFGLIAIIAIIVGLFNVVSNLFTNGVDMLDKIVPEHIHIVRLWSGQHMSPLVRHGEIVTVRMTNDDSYRHTSTKEPLWIACHVGGTLIEEDQSMGHYIRVVALKQDWTVGPDSNPAYESVRPGETRNVDFSTHLDWDYEPLSGGEVIHDCVIGGNQFQAMMQMNVDPSDWNRGHRYHYMMQDVTRAGKQRGYEVYGN
jgi:hypothetical protein